MPNCELCSDYISRRKRLDVQRTDLDLETEVLVCSKCNEICLNSQYPVFDDKTKQWKQVKKIDCTKYKNNAQFALNQKARRTVTNKKKLANIAVITGNPKFYPKAPTHKPQ
jgi:hypothetical protein